MIKRAITLLLLALPFYLAAVQQAEGRSPGPMLEVFTGGATFYSDSFHGKKTANGERYNKNEFTAAHRSLPSVSYTHLDVYKRQAQGQGADALHVFGFGDDPVDAGFEGQRHVFLAERHALEINVRHGPVTVVSTASGFMS